MFFFICICSCEFTQWAMLNGGTKLLNCFSRANEDFKADLMIRAGTQRVGGMISNVTTRLSQGATSVPFPSWLRWIWYRIYSDSIMMVIVSKMVSTQHVSTKKSTSFERIISTPISRPVAMQLFDKKEIPNDCWRPVNIFVLDCKCEWLTWC